MAAEQDPRRQPPAGGLADPTREIRLPPLPGTPGPVLPPEWAGLHRPAESTAGRPAEGPADGPTGGVTAEQPTDRLASPPAPVDREPTLTFTGSAAQRWAAGLPATPDPAWSSVPPTAGPVTVSPRARPRAGARRWPWVVLTLVPLLIIAGTGVWLLLLFR
jgi:hypothetical protein